MMILNFYILKRFLLGFLISLLVLVSIEIFFSFSSEMKYLNEGNYDFGIILKYIFLSIPRSIETMFPYSILIGALLSLGAMAADMEFVAMQSAGISVRKILTIVLLQTFFISTVFYFIVDSVVPKFSSEAESLRNTALKKQSYYNKNGTWFKNKDSFIKISEIYPDNTIKGISVYTYDNNQLSSVKYIQSAIFSNGKWSLQEIIKINLNEEPITKERISNMQSDELIDIKLIDIKTDKPYSLTLRDVVRNIEYLERNNLDASIQEKIFWDKILKPIATVLMLFLAMPYIFGRLRSTNTSKRIVIGLFIGIIFFIISSILPNLGLIIGIHPLISAILPLVVFAILGQFILRQQLESGLR
tara:strand:+ start:1029 stop:2102 length:1074 start_codon:yes stop_codon:yes gene_type:complete